MTRISKFPITKEILTRLYEIFFTVVAKLREKDQFINVMGEILSPTEKVMLAKRITIIYLIRKGVDQVTISKVLKVSTGTVSRYSIAFSDKSSTLTNLFESMVIKEHFENILNDLFTGIFIQPGIKIGHWKLYWENRKRKEFKERTGL